MEHSKKRVELDVESSTGNPQDVNLTPVCARKHVHQDSASVTLHLGPFACRGKLAALQRNILGRNANDGATPDTWFPKVKAMRRTNTRNSSTCVKEVRRCAIENSCENTTAVESQ